MPPHDAAAISKNLNLSYQPREMQQELHYCEGHQPCTDIIQHDASAFRKLFQLAHWRRFQGVEYSKKYKADENCFPTHWDCDQSNQLAGYFVHDYELRIL
jgi:hypothetical protein